MGMGGIMTQQPGNRRQRRTQPQEPETQIEEKGVVTTMTTQAVTTKLEDMSPEQRNQAFEKWMGQQDSKKVNNTAKRNAANILKGRYEDEYDKILASEKVRLAGGE